MIRNEFLPILLFLVLAALTDHITGTLVSASAFYIFPIAWAGWRLGWRYGLATLSLAMLVNLVSEWSRPTPLLPPHILMSNEALRLVVFLAVCALSVMLRRDREALAEQRDQLAHLNGQLEGEMRDARAIQQLLAAPLSPPPGVELETFFRPSKILGGDLIHLSLLTEDRLALAIGDVSGKGSPAALAGAVTLGLLTVAPSRIRSPAETLRALNQQLVGYLPEEMFITFLYALLDLSTGELVYSLAGHEYPFLVRPSGRSELLEGEGLPLGLFPEAEYLDHTLTLAPGDLLFCYTDGLPDVRQPSGGRLGVEALRQQVDLRARFPCDLLVKNVLHEVVGDRNDLEDDVSVIAVRYRPEQEETASG